MIKRSFILLSVVLIQTTLWSQQWQQKVDFTIDVSLNAAEKTLDGFEKIRYQNNSPDTLNYIWFHIWPNAYKTDRTAFSDQLLLHGDTKFYFSDKEKRGYINRLDFRVDNVTAKTEDHPHHIDIVKILLPRPLAPGQTALITTPFHIKLPFNISRSGYEGNSIQATQWYPKPALYDKDGWHEMPYLNLGEYYNNFGNYDVRITLPAHYAVAATGLTQDTHLVESQGMPDTAAKSTMHTKTLRYTQDSVHDFAWFAGPGYRISRDTLQLGERIIHIQSYYTERQQEVWKNSVRYAKDALKFYSSEVGDYPFPVLSIVQGPESFAGGMEYPTITIISPMPDTQSLDRVIAHEIGHNWFQGMLASNERDHPWMDEGINSFYEMKYMNGKYGGQARVEELFFHTLAHRKRDQPISTRSQDFTEMNYALVGYFKTAEWMKLVENEIGADSLRLAMHEYFSRYRFTHPSPEDFRNTLRTYLGDKTNHYFNLLEQSGRLPGQELKGFQFVSTLKPSTFRQYLYQPRKDILLFSPVIGANAYDGLMIGGILTNYKIPPNAFQYALVPLYATDSKQLNGSGRISYTKYTGRKIDKVELFASLSTYAYNESESGKEEDKIFSRFLKLTTGAEIGFWNRDPHSTLRPFIQWKSYFINEQPFRYTFDTTITGADTIATTSVSKSSLEFNIHQLQAGIENNRVLYPYSILLQAQGNRRFTRLSLDMNYFFNYAEGGLSARLFAGKFFYGKNDYPYGFDINRFYLNMSGVSGYEDYTYSHYFMGRNRFEGLASRQMVIRDGGFKVRTDLLANEIGQSDNWIAAINLNTSIPKKINPLSVLPIKIPLHVFLDMGTYAEAWREELDADRMIYDAGLHLPLFKGLVNIYMPLFYSTPFTDYLKSVYPDNRFFKTMSFTIDFYKLPAMIKKDLLLQ